MNASASPRISHQPLRRLFSVGIRCFCTLALLSSLISSTALGNHLDAHFLLEVHKPDEARNPAFDPTIRRFLIPAEDETGASDSPSSTPSGISESFAVPQSSSLIGKSSLIPHTQLGWTFLLNGQPEAALAAYRQALLSDPHSDAAYLGLGMTLKAIGKIPEAKQAIAKALELNPALASALVHLGYLYADGHLGSPNTDTARSLFQQALQIGDPFARIALLDLKSRPES